MSRISAASPDYRRSFLFPGDFFRVFFADCWRGIAATLTEKIAA
jgi:hypothetical protein